MRCRWASASLDRPILARIADRMGARPYSRRTDAGFRLSEVRRDHVIGEFVERVEWADQLDDPILGALSINRVEIRRVRFRISTRAPEIEFQDPPQSTKRFLNELQECAGTAVAYKPVDVSPLDWLSEIERQTGRRFVPSVRATGLTLSPSASANIVILGTEDVRAHLLRLAGRSPVQVDRVVVELPAAVGSARVELGVAGRASCESDMGEAVPLLRTALGARLALES